MFAHCDLVTQTFSFIRLLKKLGAQRPVLWFSNVFQPYMQDHWSERHLGLGASFPRLMADQFPGMLLFDSTIAPREVPSPEMRPAPARLMDRRRLLAHRPPFSRLRLGRGGI